MKKSVAWRGNSRGANLKYGFISITNGVVGRIRQFKIRDGSGIVNGNRHCI